jgi:hypothetical protein
MSLFNLSILLIVLGVLVGALLSWTLGVILVALGAGLLVVALLGRRNTPRV